MSRIKKIILVGSIILMGLFGWLLYLVSISPDMTPPAVSQDGGTYNIETPPNAAELGEQTVANFNDFLVTSAGSADFETFSIDGRQVPVTIGLDALSVDFPQKMSAALDVNRWVLHACAGDAKKPKFVLQLEFALSDNGELMTAQEKRENLGIWESTMLESVRSVIYPDSFYSNLNLTASSFGDNPNTLITDIRQATVSANGAAIGDMSYVVVGDVLLIGSDVTCMTELAVDIIGFD